MGALGKLLPLLFVVSLVFSAVEIDHCPYVIDTPGEYVVVDGDGNPSDGVLYCSSVGPGIAVKAGNVSIDFKGVMLSTQSWNPQLEVMGNYTVMVRNTVGKPGIWDPPFVVRGHVTFIDSWSYAPVMLASPLEALTFQNARFTLELTEPLVLCGANFSFDSSSIPRGAALHCHEENVAVNLSQTPFVYLYNVSGAVVTGNQRDGSPISQGVYIMESSKIVVKDAFIDPPGGDFAAGLPVFVNSSSIFINNVYAMPGFSFDGCSDIEIRDLDTWSNFAYYQDNYFFRNSRNIWVDSAHYHSLKLYDVSNATFNNLSIYNPDPGSWWGMAHTPALIIEDPEGIAFINSNISSIFPHVDPMTAIYEVTFVNSTYYGRPIYDVSNGALHLSGPEAEGAGLIFLKDSVLTFENAGRISDGHFIYAVNSNITLRNVSAGLDPTDPSAVERGYGLFELVNGHNVSVYGENLTLSNFSERGLHGWHSWGAFVLTGASNITLRNVRVNDLTDPGRPYLDKGSLIYLHHSFPTPSSVDVFGVEGLGLWRLMWVGDKGHILPNLTCSVENLSMELFSMGKMDCENISMKNVSWRGEGIPYGAAGSGASNTFTFVNFNAEGLQWVDERVERSETDDHGMVLADGFELNAYGDSTINITNSSFVGQMIFFTFFVPPQRVAGIFVNVSIDGGLGPAIAVRHTPLQLMIIDSSIKGGGWWFADAYSYYTVGYAKAGAIQVVDPPLYVRIEGSYIESPVSLITRTYIPMWWWRNNPVVLDIQGSVVNATISPYQEAYDTTWENSSLAVIPAFTISVNGSKWIKPILQLNNSSLNALNLTTQEVVKGLEYLHINISHSAVEASFWAKGVGGLERGSLLLSNSLFPWWALESGEEALINVTVLNGSFVDIKNITVASGPINITYSTLSVRKEGYPYHYLLLNPFSTGHASYLHDPDRGIYYLGVDDSYEEGFSTSGAKISIYVPTGCEQMVVKSLPTYASPEEVVAQGAVKQGECIDDVYTFTG